MPPFKVLPTRGTYTLIAFLPKETCLSVGRLGLCKFPRGHYAYTGSALGVGASGLRGRVSRHLRKEKKKFWHIDFLLANENITLTDVVAAQTSTKLECEMNRYIKENGGAEIPVPGFGASDCRQSCKSHLLFFPDIIKGDILVRKVVESYEALDLPTMVSGPYHARRRIYHS